MDSVITSTEYVEVQADNLHKAGTVGWKNKLNSLAPNTKFHQCLLHGLGDKKQSMNLNQPFCIHFIHSEHLNNCFLSLKQLSSAYEMQYTNTFWFLLFF